MTAHEPSTVVTLLIGPPGHGVVRHGNETAVAAGHDVLRFDTAREVEHDRLAKYRSVHVHYTDRLFGTNAAEAALELRRLAERLSGRVAISLHDVPFIDGSEHSRRRIAAYRVVAAAADAVIVSSRAEAARLAAFGVDRTVDVVRLPVHAENSHPIEHSACGDAMSVGVLGFVYPGKGHDDVIDAASDLTNAVSVVALGTASVGHDAVLHELRSRSRRLRQHFLCTGYLDDESLTRAARSVGVGVVPARRTSASASLNRWLAVGRRPVVARNAYTAEIAELAPHLVHLYEPSEPGALTAALAAALGEPRSTWHDGRIPDALSPAVAAAGLRDVFARSEMCDR